MAFDVPKTRLKTLETVLVCGVLSQGWLLLVSLTPWLGIPDGRGNHQTRSAGLRICYTLSTNSPQYGVQSPSLKSTTQRPSTPPNGHLTKSQKVFTVSAAEFLLCFGNMTA
jgi:hypothetical protein